MSNQVLTDRRVAHRRQRVSPGRRAAEVEEFLKLVAARRAPSPITQRSFWRSIIVKVSILLAVGGLYALLRWTVLENAPLMAGSGPVVFSPAGTLYQWSGPHRVGPDANRR
jgi:hypothetical protein